mmetsp:Transcript_66262/g.134868  ORF Transcript_66262/g.134868 Transcript_66262/m.134868 type:complete len:577 (-) Transcript_66262:1957-3687(-)
MLIQRPPSLRCALRACVQSGGPWPAAPAVRTSVIEEARFSAARSTRQTALLLWERRESAVEELLVQGPHPQVALRLRTLRVALHLSETGQVAEDGGGLNDRVGLCSPSVQANSARLDEVQERALLALFVELFTWPKGHLLCELRHLTNELLAAGPEQLAHLYALGLEFGASADRETEGIQDLAATEYASGVSIPLQGLLVLILFLRLSHCFGLQRNDVARLRCDDQGLARRSWEAKEMVYPDGVADMKSASLDPEDCYLRLPTQDEEERVALHNAVRRQDHRALLEVAWCGLLLETRKHRGRHAVEDFQRLDLWAILAPSPRLVVHDGIADLRVGRDGIQQAVSVENQHHGVGDCHDVVGAQGIDAQDVILETPIPPAELHEEECLRLLATQSSGQHNDHRGRRILGLRQVVTWAEEPDVRVLVDSHQELPVKGATKRRDVLEDVPVCLLRSNQLLLDLPQPDLRNRVTRQRVDEAIAAEDLYHSLALVVYIDLHRAGPIVEGEELGCALHAALVEALYLCPLEVDDEGAMYDDEEEVRIGLLIDDDHLAWEKPPGLELLHDGVQESRGRVVDEVP